MSNLSSSSSAASTAEGVELQRRQDILKDEALLKQEAERLGHPVASWESKPKYLDEVRDWVKIKWVQAKKEGQNIPPLGTPIVTSIAGKVADQLQEEIGESMTALQDRLEKQEVEAVAMRKLLDQVINTKINKSSKPYTRSQREIDEQRSKLASAVRTAVKTKPGKPMKKEILLVKVKKEKIAELEAELKALKLKDSSRPRNQSVYESVSDSTSSNPATQALVGGISSPVHNEFQSHRKTSKEKEENKTKGTFDFSQDGGDPDDSDPPSDDDENDGSGGDSDGGNDPDDSDNSDDDSGITIWRGDFEFPTKHKKTITNLGLFGQSSTQANYPDLPKLNTESSIEFHDWKHKVETYFSNCGLLPIVTLDPARAFQEALTRDHGRMDPRTVRDKFVELHVKVWGLLYSATVKVLHQSFFDNIGKVKTVEYAACPIHSNKWMSDFRYGNSYLLWEEINKKLDDGRSIDSYKTMVKLFTFRYKMGTNPSQTMEYFESIIRELEAAKMPIVPAMQALVWKYALPPELDAFKQGLGSQKNLGVKDIYEQLQNFVQEHSRSNRREHPKPEAGLAGFEHGQKRENPDKGKTCEHCGKVDHIKKNCWKLYPDKIPEHLKKKKGSGGGKKKGPTEVVLIALEGGDIVPKEVAFTGKEEPFIAVFDSGATSHIVKKREWLSNIRSAPTTSVSGLSSGHGLTIQERGELTLRHDAEYILKLKNVAYVKGASVNLISLSQIAQTMNNTYNPPIPMFFIDLGPQKLTIRYNLGKGKRGGVILKGEMINGLWIYNRDNVQLHQRDFNSLVLSERNQNEAYDRSEALPGSRLAIRSSPVMGSNSSSSNEKEDE